MFIKDDSYIYFDNNEANAIANGGESGHWYSACTAFSKGATNTGSNKLSVIKFFEFNNKCKIVESTRSNLSNFDFLYMYPNENNEGVGYILFDKNIREKCFRFCPHDCSDVKKNAKSEIALPGKYIKIKIESKDNEEIIKILKSFFIPIQKIIFGAPGTGKSWKVRELTNEGNHPKNVFRTVFHPEYSYPDFIGKLIPLTVNDEIKYKIQTGPFVKALAHAYKNPCECVYLVIEEINRGNSAAIFGEVFQLLDRDDHGQSEYPITAPEMLKASLDEECQGGLDEVLRSLRGNGGTQECSSTSNDDYEGAANEERCNKKENNSAGDNYKIFIPKNLSIIATMNTSDESIYFMDSAFKRRWHFEFVGINENADDTKNWDLLHKNKKWGSFREELNNIIKEIGKKYNIYKLDDKLVGPWFLKASNGVVSEEDIKFKLMFYLWDNVIPPGMQKEDWKKFFDYEEKPQTFENFAEEYETFVTKISKCES